MITPHLSPTRRNFIKTSALAATAFTLPRFSLGQAGVAANSKINVACVGIGNRGWFAVSELMKDPRVNIVAVCDVDEALVNNTYKKGAELKKNSALTCADLTTVPLFADYREMFAKMSDKIDAVTVSTPDHHHFPAAMMAVQRGKHVYVEKPLTHSVGEARALREAAKKKGIISQMGNQGRATEGIRLMKEWVNAGVIGEVRDVVAWSPTFNATYYKRPDALPLPAQTPPSTLNWDLWLGPADKRPYHETLAPVRWRGWWNFGNGMLGDWACHTLDAPFWALDLGAPTSVEAEVSDVNPEIVPEWAEVTYKFPARGKRPPVTLKWLEGARKKPASPKGWEDDPKKPGLPDRGMLMLGSANTLLAPGGRPDSPRLIPNATMEEFKKNRPAATIPRVVGGPMKEWLDAIAKTGPMPGSNFEYSVPLSEMVLLGVVAMRTGKRLEWDAKAGKVTNDAAINQLIAIKARSGWKV
ncbi:Gfo/Idh/MocA family oxidoreductase [Horticoccus sp. 23ND18S-11]|uniref:Gfo/Idh/MocA family oxidoreductase n=1 Tax=Horticoccus sp. 23ND18S-11 TaxID=3391832 RepID=UPI0039C96337